MDVCAKCQKNLSFGERRQVNPQQIDSIFPEYKNKRLCSSCRSELCKSAIEESKRRDAEIAEHCNKIRDGTPNSTSLQNQAHMPWEAVGFVLYYSKDRKCSSSLIAKIIRGIGWTDSFGLIYESFGYLVRQGHISKVDAELPEYKLTLKGEEWIKEYVLPRLHMIPKLRLPPTPAEQKKQEEIVDSANVNANAVQMMLDFSRLKDVLSKGGIAVASFNCPKCGASLDVTEIGKVVSCQYCGTKVMVVDIFEKIKSLL